LPCGGHPLLDATEIGFALGRFHLGLLNLLVVRVCHALSVEELPANALQLISVALAATLQFRKDGSSF
jgi:hypothetical protein